MITIPDTLGMSGTKNKDIHVGTSEIDAATGWHIKDKTFYENIITNVSSFGIPEYFDDRKIINYSEFCAQISLDKEQSASILRFFLPVIILLLILYVSYFINIEHLFIRLIIPLAVLIANSFYHAKLLLDLHVEYITTLEYSYLAMYLLITLSFLFVLITNKLLKKEQYKTLKLLLYSGRIVYPLIILVVAFTYFF